VRQAVSEKVSLIVSDEHAAYRNLSDKFEHAFVRHSVGRYVDGVVHTQTIDGFWSLIKQAASWALITRSAANICRFMSRNSNSGTTTGITPTFSATL
jgi:hypothetical protein